MRLVLAAIAAAVVTAANGVSVALARPATTVPGQVYTINVTLTDSSIAISRDKFTAHGQTRYPRGAAIHYAIRNHGKHPYAFRIWDAQTAPIEPGGHGSILVNWNYRGVFEYDTLRNGKPVGPKGTVIIF